jgi:hypothetical protein
VGDIDFEVISISENYFLWCEFDRLAGLPVLLELHVSFLFASSSSLAGPIRISLWYDFVYCV